MQDYTSTANDDDATGSDPSLDFTSSSFDALKALHTDPSRLQLPYPSVQPCDNLDAYHSVVSGRKRKPPDKKDSHTTHKNVVMIPPDHGRGSVGVVPPVQARGNEGVVPPDQGCGNVGLAPLAQRGGALSQVQSREQKPLGFITVLDYMRKSDLGPLELLRSCYRDGVTVRVWIRHCVGVRGVCDGVPIAFDRHMNIVLRDVVEQYVPFRTVGNGGVTEGKKRKKKKKKKRLNTEEEIRTEVPLDRTALSASCSRVMPNATTRHLKQMFIRGDNIIMICHPSQVT